MNAKEKLLRLADEFIKFAEELDEKYPQKIDFSILNDEELFTVKDNDASIIICKGLSKGVPGIYSNHAIEITKEGLSEKYENKTLILDYDFIVSIEKSKQDEKQLFYKHFPKLKPVKSGDKGVFWDDNHKLIDGCVVVGKLEFIRKGLNGKTYYHSSRHCYFDNFKKFDTLDEIVKYFGL